MINLMCTCSILGDITIGDVFSEREAFKFEIWSRVLNGEEWDCLYAYGNGGI